jgi:hypothetical protein
MPLTVQLPTIAANTTRPSVSASARGHRSIFHDWPPGSSPRPSV